MLEILQRGDRVLLRSPAPADVDAFTALTRRSRRFHAGWIAPPRDAERYAQYLVRNTADDFEALLIIHAGHGAMLGAINVSQIVRGSFHSAYLGYWIGAPYARHGYMRDALRLALRHVFETLRLHRLEANLQPTNVASRRLVEGLGFRLEGYSPSYLKIGGRWRDHERWALLRDESRRASRVRVR